MTQKHAAPSILQTSISNFEQTARRLQLDEATVRRVRTPKERIQLSLNPIMPDGRIVHIDAFVVRHSDVLGPSKGGIRMTADVTLDDISGLAMEMTWKTALIGVPFGGGKSGIRCDPKSVDPDGKEVLIRSFTRGAHRHISPEIYVPAPDMGTNEADMGHIRDCIAYSDGTSITRGCFVTGKPVILGGIIGRREATGKGVVYTIQAACDALGLRLDDLRVAVQGFGNVGSVAAAQVARAGATVIAVSDLSGGVLNPDGLDLAALAEHVAQAGAVKGFPTATSISNNDLLQLQCDVLIPAAAQSQITLDNAPLIKARMLAEGANAPTTPEADEILNDRGIFVIPDILCNAGGVFVSYLEYTQETQREQMTLEEVETRLRDRMTTRFRDVYQYAHQHRCSMRAAAMDLAVRTVVDGLFARGLHP